MMESARMNPFPFSPSSGGPGPATINVFPSQHLDQLPIAALLAFVPRLRTTYRVLNGAARPPVATGRTHYRLRLAAGQTLYLSDNLLDLVYLIDGRRSIQDLSDALAEEQGRPVHPAEIVYLLRRQLVPGGLVELSLPLALPEPKAPPSQESPARNALAHHSVSRPVGAPASGPADRAVVIPRRVTTRPLNITDDAVWIPPGRRAERLRASRRPLLAQRLRRASYLHLVATFLLILAAGGAFALAHNGFSRAGFTTPNLSTFFGGPTPTPTIVLHQPTPTPKPPIPPYRYFVQDNDTLAKIAAYFNVTVTALLLVNDMKSVADLRSGQWLIIPTVYNRGDNPANLAYPIFYVVRLGDNISSIAQFFGSTADILIHYNHLTNPGLIKPGDSVVIPLPTPTQ